MNRTFALLLLIASLNVNAQEINNFVDFRGQFSLWGNYNNTFDNYAFGGRYIPQLNAGSGNDKSVVDLELSANMFANFIGDEYKPDADIKLYRAWLRFSTPQFELRGGLQKINFGSAKILRPLMWFDSVDARDPLQLTDGVYALLARYYFLNNANIWLWGLYGNNEPKGWESYHPIENEPEFGGRIQVPALSGEMALTYHYRKTQLIIEQPQYSWEQGPENRLGFDASFDWIIGLWTEASYSNTSYQQATQYDKLLINAGADYTFGIGNGLYVIYEQLHARFNNRENGFFNSLNFSLLSASYPVSVFDNVSYMMYYNWENTQFYNFINYQRQYNKLSFNLMAFWNPEEFIMPMQDNSAMLFAGKGLQIMVVFSH
jgi:hypothetical protein